MDSVRESFDEDAHDFDESIVKYVPRYREMIEELVSAIPGKKGMKILDLGCGTGNVTWKIKQRFPDAQVTCVDFSDKMLEEAREKLKQYRDIEYVACDFRKLKLDKKYDAVTSSIAIHHLEDGDKKELYKKIYDALKPGGVFYNADAVQESSKRLREQNIERWKDFMRQNFTEEHIEDEVMPRQEHDDKPGKLVSQLDWLAEIGFRDIDVVWKYQSTAVYGSRR